jgi:hypothetical protein
MAGTGVKYMCKYVKVIFPDLAGLVAFHALLWGHCIPCLGFLSLE